MRMLTVTLIRIFILAMISIGVPSFAAKMDQETHSIVIEKFELALESMDKTAPERTGLELRLADLYADRARLKGMTEAQKNCDNCDHSKEDREKSLGYYQAAFPKVKGADQGKLLVQMAHLNNLSGNEGKAEDIYKDVIKKGKKTFTSEVVGAAYFNLGEIHFRKGEFKSALANFDKAVNEDIPNRGFLEYRRSWCQLNLGKSEQATNGLIKILSTPAWSSDNSFKEDVSHDLAQFLAHDEVTNSEIALLKKLSPDKVRRQNLFTLGSEADRLGKKQSSLLVWAAYAAEGETQGAEKIEFQIRVAQAQYDIGRMNLALTAYETATNSWKTQGCNEQDKCPEIKLRLRNFVLTWNKSVKTKPTVELLRAYQAYINAVSDDAEMIQWAALVARDVKQYKDAVVLFRRSALIARGNKASAKILEGSLLGEIEMAEASKDLKLREDAYTFYLETNPNGDKAFEARFQRANVWYQQGKYTQAYSEFHFIATQPGNEHRESKIKSADLALDTLVILKDDKSLEVRANEYARLFPERQKEYYEISRKSSMNQVATSVENKNADTSTFKASLAKLKTINLAGASQEDRVKYWKNRLLIATQAKEIGEVIVAADGLLSVAKADSDINYALTQKEWASELELNFKQAYHLTQRLNSKAMSAADRDLRLAFLADLAGASSKQHYEDYLKHEKNLRSRNLTRVTLIKRSSHPWSEMKQHVSELKKTPDLLASVALDSFGRERRLDEVSRLLSTTSIARYPDGKMLARQVGFGEFDKFKNKIARHHLSTGSDKALQRSLKERLSLLKDAGREVAKQQRNHDWTMEILALNVVAKENRRLGQELMRLPVPRGLNKDQRRQYRLLLDQQANGYLETAATVEVQSREKWTSKTFDDIEKGFETATWEVQNVMKVELQILAQNAPESAKNRLYTLMKSRRERPSNRELIAAQNDLRQNPFDSSKIERLRQLENEAGQTTMVLYLDARLMELKKRGRS
jgi:tetratricopeptide (TPR) repeat protein